MCNFTKIPSSSALPKRWSGGDVEPQTNLVGVAYTHTHTHINTQAQFFLKIKKAGSLSYSCNQSDIFPKRHRLGVSGGGADFGGIGVVISDALVVDCALTGLLPRLHPLTQPSQCAHWHRRPDMQIYSSHWCFPEKKKKHSVVVLLLYCATVRHLTCCDSRFTIALF